MRLKKLLLIMATSFVMVLATVAIVIACMPSAQPPKCPQSIFIGKFAPAMVVIPPGGIPFRVPIGMTPFVTWDPGPPQCAQPVAASTTYTLTCTPFAPAGPAFVVGPQTFGLPAPVAPGFQPVALGGGTPPGTVPFAMPAGTPPSVCLVMGTYDVTFGAGIGGGLLSGAGDTEVCLVEPSPLDDTEPRLDMEFLQPMDGPVQFHAGDQAYVFVKVANNDLTHEARFSITSDGNQVAGLPVGYADDGAAYGAFEAFSGVFRQANPDADVFPAQLFGGNAPLPFDRVPGSPLQPADQQPILQTDFVLGPGEVDIIGLAINSFGACADGSCNERNLHAEGVFVPTSGIGDSDPLRGCVSFNYLVNNLLDPQYPGLTIQDNIKVHSQVDAFWSTVQFLDVTGSLIDETHRFNLPEGGIQTTGDDLRFPIEEPDLPFFPSTWQDQLTLPSDFSALQFDVYLFDARDNFVTQRNVWNVLGLAEQLDPCPLPAISFQPGQPPPPGLTATELFIDFQSDGQCGGESQMRVRVFDGQQLQTIFQGALGELVEQAEQDPLFKVDFESCRIFSLPFGNNLDRLFLVSDPPLAAFNIDEMEPFVASFDITDQIGVPVGFAVDWEGTPGVTPIAAGPGQLQAVIDPASLVDPLDTIEGHVIVTSPGAINTLHVPIVVRKKLQAQPPPSIDIALDPPLLVDTDRFQVTVNWADFESHPAQEPGCAVVMPEGDVEYDGFFFFFDGTNPEVQFEYLLAAMDARGFDHFWVFAAATTNVEYTLTVTDTETGAAAPGVKRFQAFCGDANTDGLGEAQTRGAILATDNKLPVFTEEDLREAIDLFNDDEAGNDPLDDKTIGLVSERYEIQTSLPAVQGTYYFDEFESFRKTGAQARVTLDGGRCPAPCSGLVFEAPGGGVSNLRFENFPGNGIDIRNDSLWIASNEFSGNGAGGLLINGNNNFVADSLVRANRFEANGGPAIAVESGTGNRLLFNVFVGSNDSIWLDLGFDGRTPNDDGDRDDGPNNLQNFPVLTSVLTGEGTTIEGMLNSTPDTEFMLEFYAQWDSIIHDIGLTTVMTDANGDARIDVVLDSTLAIGMVVYATATDPDGNTSEFSEPFEIVSGVATEEPEEVPTSFRLEQNYPNPFNPSTTIRYTVAQASPVRLEVFDLLGRLVAVLVDELKTAGSHEVVFDASGLPSGAYLYKMTGDGFSQTKTLMLLK